MLDNRKIVMMTRLALFEKETGNEDFRLAKYYKMDYIRLQMLKTFICVTMAFVIAVLMSAAYKTEYILRQAAELGYGKFVLLMFVIYLLLMIVSEIAAVMVSTARIKASRKRLGQYYNQLRALRRYYKENGSYSEP